MQPKPTNLDVQIDEAVRAMRAETAPPQAESAAFAALLRPTRQPRSLLPIAVRLAGLAGTTAAVAIAVWPRPGQGLAWAQVVASAKRAPRVHEVTQFLTEKQGWQTYLEKWCDGRKYALVMSTYGVPVFESRFDGRRLFRTMPGEKYATYATPTRGSVGLSQDLGVMWTGATSIDDFLQADKTEVVQKREVKLPGGQDATRYEILFGQETRQGGSSRRPLYVYTEPATARVVMWEQMDNKGVVKARGSVEYPASIDANVFQGNPPAGTRVYDVDKIRESLRADMRAGIGTVATGGARATVRAVLLDRRNSLTVLWTGASPNGDLSQPLRIPGVRVAPTPYGLRQFSTSRGLELYRCLPSNVVSGFLGGMTQVLKEAPPERLTIQIPVFAEERKIPIRNKAGKTVGYRSRFVGYSTLRNVKPLQIPDLWSFAEELGIRRAPLTK